MRAILRLSPLLRSNGYLLGCPISLHGVRFNPRSSAPFSRDFSAPHRLIHTLYSGGGHDLLHVPNPRRWGSRFTGRCLPLATTFSGWFECYELSPCSPHSSVTPHASSVALHSSMELQQILGAPRGFSAWVFLLWRSVHVVNQGIGRSVPLCRPRCSTGRGWSFREA